MKRMIIAAVFFVAIIGGLIFVVDRNQQVNVTSVSSEDLLEAGIPKEIVEDMERSAHSYQITMVIAAAVMAVIGLFMICKPEKFWELQHLMTVEGGSPTSFGIGVNRFAGVICIVIAVILLYQGIWG